MIYTSKIILSENHIVGISRAKENINVERNRYSVDLYLSNGLEITEYFQEKTLAEDFIQECVMKIDGNEYITVNDTLCI